MKQARHSQDLGLPSRQQPVADYRPTNNEEVILMG